MAHDHDGTDECPACAEFTAQVHSAFHAIETAFDAWLEAQRGEGNGFAFQLALEHHVVLLAASSGEDRAQDFKDALKRLRSNFPSACRDVDEAAQIHMKAN